MASTPGWRARSAKRPEQSFSALEYYESEEGKSHVEKNAVRKIQRGLTMRALLLAKIPLQEKLLDAGCGSGYSLELLKEAGYKAQGFDLSPRLVALAKAKKLDARVGDIQKIPFPDAAFGGIISISALQWLLQGTEKEQKEKLSKCASEFWRVLKAGGKAAIQFYPESEEQAMVAAKAFRAKGFKTILHTENPENARKRKVFILLEK
ncbi:MAG: class I SAM-dependent methyltransferase [Candidatus Micrarchaeia archaeon]|jgi:18S rRNA (guanine1575-N7)-methyltransferase